jgi:YVTN family beta-propeller protein
MFERFTERARRVVVPAGLARARARVRSTLAEGQGPANRAARSWPGRAARAKPGGRWTGWLAPLAAAAAVAAVIAGIRAVSRVLHGPGVTPADEAIAYVVNQGSGTVTPIRAATSTALPPIKVGVSPEAIAITPDGKTAYVANVGSGTVTPIRTATNTALTPITVGRYPIAIAITTPASPTP